MHLPEAAEPILIALFVAFTQPSFQRFWVLTVGAILTSGPRTVLRMLSTLGPLATTPTTTGSSAEPRGPPGSWAGSSPGWSSTWSRPVSQSSCPWTIRCWNERATRFTPRAVTAPRNAPRPTTPVTVYRIGAGKRSGSADVASRGGSGSRERWRWRRI